MTFPFQILSSSISYEFCASVFLEPSFIITCNNLSFMNRIPLRE